MTHHNLKQLKKLNQVVFPVSYNDKFYKDVLEVGELAKLGEQLSMRIGDHVVDAPLACYAFSRVLSKTHTSIHCFERSTFLTVNYTVNNRDVSCVFVR